MKRSYLLGICGGAALAFSVAGLRAAETESADKSANPTAYAALRAMQKNLGDKSLEKVVEVTGRDGVPQPYVWRILLREPDGMREVQVVSGKASKPRPTMVKGPAATGNPLRLQELNLDSSGAFDAADAQARKTKLRFDSINYALEIIAGRPEWTLELFDQNGSSVGKMHLAANNGTTASIEGRLAAPPSVTAGTTRATTTTTTTTPPVVVERRPLPTPLPVPPSTTVTTATAPPVPGATTTVTTTTETDGRPIVVEDQDEDDPDTGFFMRAGRTIDHTNHTVARSVVRTNETVKRSFRRTGATIQRFFTGHSEIDQENSPAPPR